MFCIPYVVYTLARCNQLSIDHIPFMEFMPMPHRSRVHRVNHTIQPLHRQRHQRKPGGRDDPGPRLGALGEGSGRFCEDSQSFHLLRLYSPNSPDCSGESWIGSLLPLFPLQNPIGGLAL